MASEELKQRTKLFALRVFKLVDQFPKSRATDIIANQLLRSSCSVAANYRASQRAKSKADFINKLAIVDEESDESLFWLEILKDLEIFHSSELDKLIKEADELTSIFTASLITSKSRR